MAATRYSEGIAPSNETRYVLKASNASVAEIMQGIVYADNESYTDTAAFARRFDFSKIKDFEKLWRIARYEIDYVQDSAGTEVIKSPSALWQIGRGDCKSKSLFIGSVLRNAGIPYFYRFAHYGDPSRGHVYVVAISPKHGEIILDSVHTVFDEEVPYRFKLDYDPDSGQTFDRVGNISSKPKPYLLWGSIAVALILIFKR